MNEIKWGDPRPLRQSADAIPFPLDALPSVLRNMSQAISVTTSTDVGMAGTAMLSAVGYCFTGLYRLAGKADHTEPPVLYSIIIAQPSERKSPVMHFIKEPFDSFESKYNKDHREKMYKAQQDVKALEAHVKSMEKEDEPDTAAIAKLRVQADNIRNTTPIRIAVDDITPESLVIELSENDSLLMISDEAGMLSNFNGKYNGGIPNLDLLLKAWNGEKYICNRVIRGRTEIPRPYLSVALAGQPYIWDNMMNDTAFRSSGLIARFVPCFAKSDVGNRRYDTAPISKEVREQYHNFIHQLLRGKKDHNGEETILHLSRHASEEYIDYCNKYIEKEIKESMCCCQDWGGKFHGLILRIACILHCADCCSRGVEPSDESVNHDTLVRSFSIAHYYRYQAIYGFSVNAPDGNIVKAEKIIQIIKTKNIKQGLKSDLYHACRCNLFPSAKDFYSALDTLAEYGYVAYEDVTAANNKKTQMNKKGKTMKEKRISFGQGKGSLTHNNREFVADNIDPLRTPQNITFVRQPIGEAYDQLFAESTQRYNAKQKRNDRKVHGSYYEHLFGVKPCNTVRTAADKRKSFYEDVVQIGKREDSGYGTEDFELVADCLKEYMEGFQNRNPNFHVFNAVLHMDEATPHLHIDYIPVGHYKRGQDVQNGIAQALKEMGYGEGKQAIARWRAAEVEVLNAICLEHGIKPLAPEKARGTLEVEEYKEQRRQADELALQNVQVEAQIAVKKAVLSTTETQLEEQQKLLGDTQEQVREATADLMEQTRKIEDGETELSEMIDKVEKKKQEYQRIEKNANDILNLIPNYEKDDQAERDFELIQTTLGGLTRNAMAAMKNRDEINVQVGELCKILKKALNKVHKYSITIGEQRQLLHKIEKLNDELTDKNKSLYSRNRELSADNNTLKKKYDTVMAVYRKVESIAPEAITQAKMLVEAERQREQELQQLEAQSRKKKKSWGLE